MSSTFANSSSHDEWAQLESVTDRRKVQNRLAQRKYRHNIKNRQRHSNELDNVLLGLELMSSPAGQSSVVPERTFDDMAGQCFALDGGLASPSSPAFTIHSAVDRLQEGHALQVPAAVYESDSFPAPSVHDCRAITARPATPGTMEYAPSEGRGCVRAGWAGDSPLHHAVRNGHVDVARLLLARRADPNAANCDGQRPLHLAAERGDLALVRLLLEAEASLEAYDNSGAAPIHAAAANGRATTVALMLDTGADVDQPSMVRC